MDETASQSKTECKMPWPAYAEIFEFQQNLGNDKNWGFLCKICIGKIIIHASKSSTANLRKHISVSVVIYKILTLMFLLKNSYFSIVKMFKLRFLDFQETQNYMRHSTLNQICIKQ